MKSYSILTTMYLKMLWFVMKNNAIKHLYLKYNFLMYINKVHIPLAAGCDSLQTLTQEYHF